MKRVIITILLIIPLMASATSPSVEFLNRFTPRMRVIIDNDFSGDPDGLFQLVHHVLSPSVELRGIIGSHLNDNSGFDNSDNTAQSACDKANELLALLNANDLCPVVPGAATAMTNHDTPIDSEGARLIISEALRDDVATPLYIVCGAGLTNIASALLLNPDIAHRLILVWIGGQEYEDTAPMPPGGTEVEYNLALSIPGAQTVFNKSSIPIWQVPRNAYRQCIMPMSRLYLELSDCGEIGKYLFNSLTNIMSKINQWGGNMGETYILGDSPLVLLTALQTGFESDPASSDYIIAKAPHIEDNGTYKVNPKGRYIRVYQQLDTQLMYCDLFSKLRLIHK